MTRFPRLPRHTRKALLAAASAAALSAPGAAHAASGGWGQVWSDLGDEMLKLGGPLGVALYALAIIFLIAFVIALFGLGSQRGNSSPKAAILFLVAAVGAASSPTVLGLSSKSLTGAAPSITGNSSAPLSLSQ